MTPPFLTCCFFGLFAAELAGLKGHSSAGPFYNLIVGREDDHTPTKRLAVALQSLEDLHVFLERTCGFEPSTMQVYLFDPQVQGELVHLVNIAQLPQSARLLVRPYVKVEVTELQGGTVPGHLPTFVVHELPLPATTTGPTTSSSSSSAKNGVYSLSKLGADSLRVFAVISSFFFFVVVFPPR